MSKKKQKLFGRCYELSGKFLIEHREWNLVHGIITDNHFGTNATITHGWCEKGEIVYDSVYEQEFPKLAYYHLYGIVDYRVNQVDKRLGIPETIKVEYTYEEATELMTITENFGPWDERILNYKSKPSSKVKITKFKKKNTL